MVYCPRCPGKLSQRQISAIPKELSDTGANIAKHLKTQGLDYFGEFPEQKLKAQIESCIINANHSRLEKEAGRKTLVGEEYWNRIKLELERELATLKNIEHKNDEVGSG